MSYRNKVSKVLLNRHALKEMAQYLRVARADKKSHYYLGKPIECKIMETKENINAVKGCEEGANIVENMDDYSLLVMRDGGIDIEIYTKKLRRLSKDMQHRLEPFWWEFLRMFEGCALFLKHGIINHDIKPQNILYDEHTKRMNYIDFGLMQSYRKVLLKLNKSDFWLAKHAHWSYPLEIQFLNKLRYADFMKKSEKEKMEFYSKIIRNINERIETYNSDTINTLFSYILPSEDSVEFSNKYFHDVLNMLTVDITVRSYSEFIKKSLDTIDIYGVGFTIMFAANRLKMFIDKEFYHDLMDFGYNLITPRVFERYSVEQAITKYRELLNKHISNNKDIVSIRKSLKNIHKKTFTKKKRDNLAIKNIRVPKRVTN